MAGEIKDDIDSTTVVKGGEICIDFSLERSSEGLKAIIKAHPRVEEFLRNLGGGEFVHVGSVNRYWVPIKGSEEKPLVAYALNQKLDVFGPHDLDFSIDRLGAPLLEEVPDYKRERINLSFIRLQGISEGNGVAFSVKGVYSRELVTKMLDGIGVGLRKFYIDFIRPMNVNVQISIQSL